MPSLFRFLLVVGVVGTVAFAGLYVLAVYFEPQSREASSVVLGVKVRR
ncbi:MAG: hypothetical protein AB7K67_13395 [Hyphomicrobiaceae bacterium]|jgi:hypothetical protein